MCLVPREALREHHLPWNWSYDGCKLMCVLGIKSGPLDELSGLLTAEPSFQPQNLLFLNLSFHCVFVSAHTHIAVHQPHLAYLIIHWWEFRLHPSYSYEYHSYEYGNVFLSDSALITWGTYPDVESMHSMVILFLAFKKIFFSQQLYFYIPSSWVHIFSNAYHFSIFF